MRRSKMGTRLLAVLMVLMMATGLLPVSTLVADVWDEDGLLIEQAEPAIWSVDWSDKTDTNAAASAMDADMGGSAIGAAYEGIPGFPGEGEPTADGAGKEGAEAERDRPEVHSAVLLAADASAVSFDVTPADAVVAVYDATGERVNPDVKWVFTALVNEESYSYTVAKYGYIAQKGSFVYEGAETIAVSLTEAPVQERREFSGVWLSYRGNAQNMGATGAPTARNVDESVLKWAKSFSSGGFLSAAPNAPVILDDTLIFSAGSRIYKVDRLTGETIIDKPMIAAPSFGITSVTYGNGMIFANINNGRIQAFDADTLDSLWVSEQMGGQALSPIVYHDGYVYSGFWTSEVDDNYYVCLSISDEDPDNSTDVKTPQWKHKAKGGYYWAGGIVAGDYILFGCDNGSGSMGTVTTDGSRLYALDRITGEVADVQEGLTGDQRSGLSYDAASGRFYFTTKAGYVGSVMFDESAGKFIADSFISKQLVDNWQATGTPVVHDGLLFIGTGAGVGAGGKFVVARAETLDVIDSTDLIAYPQGSPLLSTAYENETGKLYLYTTYNKNPGGLTVVEYDKATGKLAASEVYTPGSGMQNYCIDGPVCDADGTIYYHNDSGYIFAIGRSTAHLTALSADVGVFRHEFSLSTTSYDLIVPADTRSVQFNYSAPDGMLVQVDGAESATGSAVATLTEGAAVVTIRVTDGSYIRAYTINIIPPDTGLTIAVNESNSAPNASAYREFKDGNYSYSIAAATTWERVWLKLSDGGATWAATVVSGVANSNTNGNPPLKAGTSLSAIAGIGESPSRLAIAWADGYADMVVKVTVTAADRVTTEDYFVKLTRGGSFEPKTPVLITGKASRINDDEGTVSFISDKPGKYFYTVVKSGTAEPEVDATGTGIVFTHFGTVDVPVTGLADGGEMDVYIKVLDSVGESNQIRITLPAAPIVEPPVKPPIDPPGEPVTVLVSIQLDDSGFSMAKQAILIETDISERNGYIDAYSGAEATVMDALVAAHIRMYGDDWEDYLKFSGGTLRMLAGQDASNSYFFINGSLSFTDGVGDTPDTALLATNDDLLFYLLQDEEYLADSLVWFADSTGKKIDEMKVEAGEEFEVTLTGYLALFAFFYDDVGEYIKPIESARIAILDMDSEPGFRRAFFGERLGLTGKDGSLALRFDEPGNYVISAYDDSGDDWPFTAPWLTVTVEGDEEPPICDKQALSDEIILTEGLHEAEYTALSWKALEDALARAKIVMAHDGAVQAEADIAKDALAAAILALIREGSEGGLSLATATISVRDDNAKPGQTRVYFSERTFEIEPNETAYSLLARTGLSLRVNERSSYAGVYVEAINGFGEFDDGSGSGWMYKVNGEFPDHSSSLHVLDDGDKVEWVYTRDLGADVGGEGILGNNGSGSTDGNENSNGGLPGAGGTPGSGGNLIGGAGVLATREAKTPSVSLADWKSPFIDVKPGDWYYEAVAFAQSYGLMSGVEPSVFAPDANLSRAMLVTILWRMEEAPGAEGGTFTDVPTGEWYTEAVAWAAANGIVGGYGNGLFGPGDAITREQLAAILLNYARYKKLAVAGDSYRAASYSTAYSDIGDVSAWAQEAVKWANGLGLINGRGADKLAPLGTTIRAEAAAILQRFIMQYMVQQVNTPTA